MAPSLPELKTFLLETPFFGGLPQAGLDFLMSTLVERPFEAGATVVAEGEPGRSMFVVHSGQLSVTKRTEAGLTVPLSRLGPGDFFGEITLIAMQNRSATVRAETPTVLYEISARSLYALYKADVHAYVLVLQNINRELCRRLCHADLRFSTPQSGSSDPPMGGS